MLKKKKTRRDERRRTGEGEGIIILRPTIRHVDEEIRRENGDGRTRAREIRDRKYSLLGGIRELVFPSAIVTLLYTGVRPQILDRLHVRGLERRHRLEVYAPHEFRFFLKREERARE